MVVNVIALTFSYNISYKTISSHHTWLTRSLMMHSNRITNSRTNRKYSSPYDFSFVVVIVVVIVKSVRCSLIMCFLLCGITMESKDCFIFILGENSQHILTQFSIQKTFTIFIGTYGPTTLYERIHRTEKINEKPT